MCASQVCDILRYKHLLDNCDLIDVALCRSGPGILGFGFSANGQKTTLTAAARSGALAVSYYFRKSFVVSGVPDGSSIVGYLNYLVDDGAVVYVNGVEVSKAEPAESIFCTFPPPHRPAYPRIARGLFRELPAGAGH